MTSPTFTRLQQIFSRAAELDGEAREAFLGDEARTAPDLVDKVRDLLRADEALRRARTVRPDLETLAGDPAVAGQRIGPFAVRELLGRGGMGAVYLAERADGAVEQRVAVKVLRGTWLDDAGRRRFQVESQILARLEHPSIARLIDVGETRDGAPYLAMEHVPGLPISEYCDRERLDVEARVRLFRRVCEAVGFAHRSLIVHRDLKPENVLVTDDGPEQAQVKLVDFGIAKPLTGRLGPIDVASTGTLGRVFSPSYAAPEQVAGDATTVATDVYGLGVVLYELLSGALPFPAAGKSPREVEDAVLRLEPAPPSRRLEAAADEVARARGASTAERLGRRLRGDLDSIVLKCLRKAPADRYSTVDDLAADLDRFLEGRPVLAREGRFAYRAGKLLRRRRVPLAVAAAALVALLAGLSAFYRQAVETERERDRARLVTDFMVSAFEAADPTRSLGADVTAAQILEQSLRRLEAEEPENPRAVAELLLAIARVQASLGLGKEAAATLDRATALFEPSRRDRDLETRLLLTRTAVALGERRIDEARELARHGLDSPRLTPAQALAFELRLAQCAFQESRYDDARARLEGMLPRLSGLGPQDASLGFDVRNELGRTLEALGRFDEALAVFEKVLEERRSALPPEHPDLLDSLYRIAEMYNRQGRAEEYGRLADEIIERTTRLYGAESLAMGSVFNTRATVSGRAGDVPGAIKDYERALAIYRRHYGDAHPHVAMMSYNIALAATQDPAFRDQADASFRRSIEVGSSVWREDHRNLHLFRTIYALWLNERGRFGEARQQAAAALEAAEARPEFKQFDVYALAELAHAVAALASSRSPQAEQDVEHWLAECSTFPPGRRTMVLPQARIAEKMGAQIPEALRESLPTDAKP